MGIVIWRGFLTQPSWTPLVTSKRPAVAHTSRLPSPAAIFALSFLTTNAQQLNSATISELDGAREQTMLRRPLLSRGGQWATASSRSRAAKAPHGPGATRSARPHRQLARRPGRTMARHAEQPANKRRLQDRQSGPAHPGSQDCSQTHAHPRMSALQTGWQGRRLSQRAHRPRPCATQLRSRLQ